jgi:hypothetical protein
MATNHLVGLAITLHNIPKDWLLEFFGGVAAGIRSFYCWGCNIGYRLFRIFLKELPCVQFAKNGNEQMEKFYVWAIFRIGRAYCSCLGLCSYVFTPILPYALALRQVP